MNKKLLAGAAIILLVGGLVGTGAVPNVGPAIDLFNDGDHIGQPGDEQVNTSTGVFLAPANTTEGATYASIQDGNLSISVDDLNRRATTRVSNLFVVGYAGDEEARVGFNTDPHLQDPSANVTFVNMDTNQPIADSQSELDPGVGADSLVLAPGDKAVVGIDIETGTQTDVVSAVNVLADVANARFVITNISAGGVAAGSDDEIVVRAGQQHQFVTEVTSTGTSVAFANRTLNITSELFADQDTLLSNVPPGGTASASIQFTPGMDKIGQIFNTSVSVTDPDQFGEGSYLDDLRNVTIAVSTSPRYNFTIPGGSGAHALGFPAGVTESSYADIIDPGGPINVFEYNATSGSFEQVSFTSDGPDPLDAVVITTSSTAGSTQVSFQLADPGASPDSRVLTDGLNFVPAATYGGAGAAFNSSFAGNVSEIIDRYRTPSSGRLLQYGSFEAQTGNETFQIGTNPVPSANAFQGYFVRSTNGTYTSAVAGVSGPRSILRYDTDSALDVILSSDLSGLTTTEESSASGGDGS